MVAGLTAELLHPAWNEHYAESPDVLDGTHWLQGEACRHVLKHSGPHHLTRVVASITRES